MNDLSIKNSRRTTSVNLIFSSLTVFLFLSFLMPGCQKTTPLAKFRSDLTNSGLYSQTVPFNMGPIVWKFQTGGYVFSSPVVSNQTVFIGSNDSCCYALDEVSGQLKWKFKTQGVVSSTPAIYDGLAYFLSFDGKLYALNTSTGEKVWEFSCGAEKQYTNHGIHGLQPKDQMIADSWDMYLSSPAVYKNKIFFGSGNGKFYALDRKTGKEIWNFQTSDVIHSSPAIQDDVVYFGGWDTYLHALQTETGKEIWKFATGIDTAIHNQTGIQSSPVIYDDYVYFGCRDAHVYALDKKTGNLKWKKYNNGSWVINTPVVRDSVLYYGTSDTHKLWAVNALTGDSIYQKDLKAFIFSSPVLAGDKILAADFSGCFFAMDAKTGYITWKFRTEASGRNALNVLDDKGLIPNSFFETYFKDGYTPENNAKMMKALYSIGSFLSTPWVGKDLVFIGNSDGCVYAFHTNHNPL